ncbi:TPA: hypothetical protein SMR42_004510 [Pseudomonas putida]|nr:hypothetical protein [Pseudomonas putida]
MKLMKKLKDKKGLEIQEDVWIDSRYKRLYTKSDYKNLNSLFFKAVDTVNPNNLTLPDLPIDKAFSGVGYKLFEIDGAAAGNALTLTPYPRVNEQRYVASYYNYVRRGTPGAGLTMFDEKGDIVKTFGKDGHHFILLSPGDATIPISSFVDVQGNLNIYAESIELVSPYMYQHSYLIRMNHEGVEDVSFGDNGRLNLDELVKRHFAPRYEEYDDAYCLRAFDNPKGGYYLTCHILHRNTNAFANMIVRLNADGTIDETFGAAGGALIPWQDEVSPYRFIQGLAVYGNRLVTLLVDSDDTIEGLLRAFTLDGKPDLDYGKEGTGVVRPDIFGRRIELFSDGTLGVVGFETTSEGPDRSIMCTVDKFGVVTSGFEVLDYPSARTWWGSASLANRKIYCTGGVGRSPAMLGCYLADTKKLDTSFGGKGYGVLRGAVPSMDDSPVLLPTQSLLTVGRWAEQAAVFAVKTT